MYEFQRKLKFYGDSNRSNHPSCNDKKFIINEIKYTFGNKTKKENGNEVFECFHHSW